MIVNVPVYGDVEFPDSMTPEEIEKAIQVNLGLGAPREVGITETIRRGLSRGATADIRGGAQLLRSAGIDVGAGDEGFEASDPLTAMMGTPLAPAGERASLATPDVKQETDFEQELRLRLAQEQNPVLGYGSQIAGSIASPLNLLPLGTAKTAGQMVRQFATAGAVGGALDPVYEEFDDSRLLNTGAGAAIGGILGGAVRGVSKLIEKYGRKEAEDILSTGSISPDGNTIVTPHYKLTLDETGEWVKEEIPVSDTLLEARKLAEERRSVTPETPEVPTAQDAAVFGAQDITREALPVLPSFLSGAKPRFAKSNLEFETDIDKALYIVGNPTTKSAKHDDYMAFLEKALGKTKEEISSLASTVRREVIEAGKVAQAEAGLSGIKEVSSINFKLSKAVDNLLNPPDKYLDDFSKRVYNLGAGYRVGPSGYAVLNPKQAQEALSIMQRADPTFVKSMPDAARNVVAYRRYLDDMKALNGRDYKPRSFEDFITKGISADDQIKMLDAGFFDGCR
jgi:hypothetical protein